MRGSARKTRVPAPTGTRGTGRSESNFASEPPRLAPDPEATAGSPTLRALHGAGVSPQRRLAPRGPRAQRRGAHASPPPEGRADPAGRAGETGRGSELSVPRRAPLASSSSSLRGAGTRATGRLPGGRCPAAAPPARSGSVRARCRGCGARWAASGVRAPRSAGCGGSSATPSRRGRPRGGGGDLAAGFAPPRARGTRATASRPLTSGLPAPAAQRPPASARGSAAPRGEPTCDWNGRGSGEASVPPATPHPKGRRGPRTPFTRGLTLVEPGAREGAGGLQLEASLGQCLPRVVPLLPPLPD